MRSILGLALVLLLFCQAASGQIAGPSAGVVEGRRAPDLPSDPTAWLNASPLTNPRLAGKGVVLLFADWQFRQPWAVWQEVPQKFKDHALIYVAVLPGAPRAAAQSYVAQQQLKWPVLVDPNRSLEKAFGVPTIGEGQRYYLVGITHDGKLASGIQGNLTETSEKLSQGAKWDIAPLNLHPSLQAVWLQLEIGNPALVAGQFKQTLKSTDPKLRADAEVLQSTLKKVLEAKTAIAKTDQELGHLWDAYVGYSTIVDLYKGFDVPAEADAARKALSITPEVRIGQSAKRNLDGAKRMLMQGNSKQAVPLLKKIVVDLPDSSLGKEARELLTQLGESP